MTKELIDFLFGSLQAFIGVIIGGIFLSKFNHKIKKKHIFLIGFLFYLTAVMAAFFAKFTKLIWLSYSLPVFFGLVLFWVSLRNFRITLLMVYFIRKHKFSEAVRIGEKEIKQGNDVFGVKLNLISAYYYDEKIDKALSIIENVDVNKLSSYDKKLFDDWKKKLRNFQI